MNQQPESVNRDTDLTMRDSVRILLAANQHVGFLRDTLGLDVYRQLGMAPSPNAVWGCLLEAPSLGTAVAPRIQLMIKKIDAWETQLRGTRWSIEERLFLATVASAVVSAQTAPEMVGALKCVADVYRKQAGEFSTAIKQGIDFLEHGAGILYVHVSAFDGGKKKQQGGVTTFLVTRDCAGQAVLGAISGFIRGGFAGAVIGAGVGALLCVLSG